MKEDDKVKELEQILKDEWKLSDDPEYLLKRLKVIDRLWDDMDKTESRSEWAPDRVMTLMLMVGILAAKIAPAIGMEPNELSNKIRDDHLQIPTLTTFIEEKVRCLKKKEPEE